jgi:hypothetical protein
LPALKREPRIAYGLNTVIDAKRLMTLRNALDRDIEIVIRKKPRLRQAERIRVVAGVIAFMLARRSRRQRPIFSANCAENRRPNLRILCGE